MSATICAGCRRMIAEGEGHRNVCISCWPRSNEEMGVSWWMGVAEAKQKERDLALDELRATRRELDLARGREADLEQEAYLWSVAREALVAAGCSIVLGCHVPTVLSKWLESLKEKLVDGAADQLLLIRKNEALGVFADPEFWTQRYHGQNDVEWIWLGRKEYVDPVAFAKREMKAEEPDNRGEMPNIC